METDVATNETKNESCMSAEPQAEHRWLQQLVGEWTYEAEAMMEPGQPPAKHAGTENVHPIGGLWIRCEGRGEMPGGGPAEMQVTLGYDPEKKRFVGTWVGSMMTHLWLYEGELDAGRRTLSLEAEGPDMANPGGTARYKDVIEIESADHRVLKSHMLGSDGQWQLFMTAHYRRKK